MLSSQLNLESRNITHSSCIYQASTLSAAAMVLSGHESCVYTLKFSPDGTVCASGSHDKTILLWRVFSARCENFSMLRGHLHAVVELHWTQDGERIVSCSPDNTIRAWDANTGRQLKCMKEHEAFVNTCYPLQKGAPLLVSGADDGCIKIWDLRAKRSSQTIWAYHPVTAVSSSHTTDVIYSGGIDNNIKAWDLRKNEVVLNFSGHTDTITGLCISPDAAHLLSNSMDNTLRIWDLRSYAVKTRSVGVLTGHLHTSEKTLLKCDWSHDSKHVSAGSGDCKVHIWDVKTKKVIESLSGHLGSVNEVAFHPSMPIIGSCSSDKQIILGNITN